MNSQSRRRWDFVAAATFRWTMTPARRPAAHATWQALPVVAALALLLLGAAPARAATISVTSGLAIEGPGAAGTVQVAADVAAGIESLDLRIAFQSGTVVIGSQPVVIGVASNCAIAANDATPGELAIALACGAPLTGGGPILSFGLVGVTPGASALTVTRCELNEGALTCTPVERQRHGQAADADADQHADADADANAHADARRSRRPTRRR